MATTLVRLLATLAVCAVSVILFVVGVQERTVIIDGVTAANAWENSTLPYHVWPMPLKVAVVLNMPAFVLPATVGLLTDLVLPRYENQVTIATAAVLMPFQWWFVCGWILRSGKERLTLSRLRRSHAVFVPILTIVGGLGVLWGLISLYIGFIGWGLASWGMGGAMALTIEDRLLRRQH